MPKATTMNSENGINVAVISKEILYPFVLVTSLFALWGYFESSLVQFAFYGGYCVMAIPAALFIKRFTYKSGILVGLGLYSLGTLLFIPSSMIMGFWAFLISYFILTCGLSFLETSSNPYILSMGANSFLHGLIKHQMSIGRYWQKVPRLSSSCYKCTI